MPRAVKRQVYDVRPSRGGGWTVKAQGGAAGESFDRKTDAIAAARKRAKSAALAGR